MTFYDLASLETRNTTDFGNAQAHDNSNVTIADGGHTGFNAYSWNGGAAPIRHHFKQMRGDEYYINQYANDHRDQHAIVAVVDASHTFLKWKHHPGEINDRSQPVR